ACHLGGSAQRLSAGRKKNRYGREKSAFANKLCNRALISISIIARCALNNYGMQYISPIFMQLYFSRKFCYAYNHTYIGTSDTFLVAPTIPAPPFGQPHFSDSQTRLSPPKI